MLPDDPRHGEYAGASQHWKDREPMCQPCADAASRRRKLNRVLRETGRAKFIPSLGTVRRIQALRCLGWTVEDIAREAEVPAQTLRSPSHRGTYVHRDTFNAVAGVYERWCMTRPVGGYHERSRRYAASKGWLPPLAWDDIDRDVAPCDVRRPDVDQVDEVAIQRRMSGDRAVALTKAESVELVRRWRASGRPANECARVTGLKPERYYLMPSEQQVTA